MTEPARLRSLDAILALADNGQYLPDLLTRNQSLVADLQDFSRAYGG